MVATLARSGSNSWSLGDKRYFDAWGDVEQGSGAGQPSQCYCANLGHVQDDESDLIYMRARYYEPGVGRFLSEDPARDGSNWYSYCRNLPVMLYDYDGRVTLGDIMSEAADEVYEKFREMQQANVTLQWAENAIVRALTKWSNNVAEHLVEAAYGEEFLLPARASATSGLGIQLTGISGKINIGIVFQGGNIIVKTYDAASKHITPNINVPPFF